jgi:hypothetical protein
MAVMYAINKIISFLMFLPPPNSCSSFSSLLLVLGMKTVSEFFGILETDFEIFRSDSSVTVFLKTESVFGNFYRNRCGVLPFVSFGYRFFRKLPDLCLEIFQNFSELCLGIFRIFPACDFSHRMYVSR